jgi:signal transduction histidine kinase
LDDFLPAPCMVLGVLIVFGSEAPGRSAAVIAAYLVANIGLTKLIQRHLEYFLVARNVTSVLIFVILGWISGPESSAWTLGFVGIFGAVFSQSGISQGLSILGFSLAAAVGAKLGGHTQIESLAVAATLLSVGWMSSGMARVLYGTWLSAQVNAEALEDHNQALENALATRQAFLATMSHEVRTPLNGVLGMTELLARTPLEPDQKSMLETIHSSGEGLLQVLNDILDTAKLDAGKIALETLPYDPAELAESVCHLMRTQVQGRPVVLLTQADPSLPPSVSGDPARLRQVLLNLVGNALKFTEQGQVVVALSWSEERLSVSVRDTGIGISEQAQITIFEPFRQAESGTTRQYGGTGLGLTICRRLVSLMGGELDLQSTLGQGSCFTLSLSAPELDPLIKSHMGARVGPLPAVVLVVEDNPVNLLVTLRMLDTLGCACLTAANGEEALEMVAEHDIDLILMDCRMPVMDGFEATRRLRAQAHFMPILALTAGVTEDERRVCDAAGMDAVLPKPLTLATLRDALHLQMDPERIQA